MESIVFFLQKAVVPEKLGSEICIKEELGFYIKM